MRAAAAATGSPISACFVYLTVLTALIARSAARRRLGQHVDGRPPRHGARRASRHAVARLVVTTSARRSGRRAQAHPRLFRPRSDVPDLRRDRPVPPPHIGTLRSADRRAVGTDAPTPRAAGRPLGYRLRPCRRPVSPSAAPPDLAGLGRDLPDAHPARPGIGPAVGATAAWPCAGKPAVIEFEGVGHAPMLMSADQIEPVVLSALVAVRPPSPFPSPASGRGTTCRWRGSALAGSFDRLGTGENRDPHNRRGHCRRAMPLVSVSRYRSAAANPPEPVRRSFPGSTRS
jgi:hypothetical protein